ncbi:MAG: sigma 54-interacting transcriptional regulator [Planctomycetota bacterium]|nr:sigma 54-interacting transcriptional regulator [Planctomycetota bacterium]
MTEPGKSRNEHLAELESLRARVLELEEAAAKRKHAEENLHETNSLLSGVIEGTTDAVFVKDLQGRYLMINTAGERVIGRTHEEVIGKNDIELFPHETASHIVADDRRILDGGKPQTFETLIPVRGTLRTFLSTKTVYRNHQGAVIGLIGISRDITERKQAEKAHQEMEARAREQFAELNHIYNTAPVGLCLLDTNLRILRINEQLAAMGGLSVADHIGRSIREIVPEIAKKVESVCYAVIETGEPALNLERRTSRPTDPDVEMTGLMSLYPLRSSDGSVRALSVVVQDITELKWAEEAYRESEERFSRILESAMDAIVTIDERHIIQVFNAAATDVFRCKVHEAIGQPFDRFMSTAFRELLAKYGPGPEQSDPKKRHVWVPDGLKAIRADGEEFPAEATISQFQAAGRTLFTIILRDVNERKRADAELRKLELENLYLQEAAQPEFDFGEMVGSSKAFKNAMVSVEKVAATDSTVLLIGDTGTGKELIARAVHNLSGRKRDILITVSCAALPGGLIESEFFGHEKGAFTGALTRRTGRFEMADGGTIFLDEIGDLPLDLQAKLLRVLQEGEFERVGGAETLKVDVRVIAATHRNLTEAVENGSFRADLFYRLNVFPIRIPPLRDRRDDIPRLARYFAMKYGMKMGKQIKSIPESTLNALSAYDWPGNVRELQNVIERAVILSTGPRLEIGEWPPAQTARNEDAGILTLDEQERRHIRKALEQTNWQVSGPDGAAEILDMKPTTLNARMKKLGIRRKS